MTEQSTNWQNIYRPESTLDVWLLYLPTLKWITTTCKGPFLNSSQICNRYFEDDWHMELHYPQFHLQVFQLLDLEMCDMGLSPSSIPETLIPKILEVIFSDGCCGSQKWLHHHHLSQLGMDTKCCQYCPYFLHHYWWRKSSLPCPALLAQFLKLFP